MSQRVIIGLESGADSANIKKQLVNEGAELARESSLAQPDVLVVTIPEDRSVDEFLSITKRLPGVRYAERDAMRFTC